MEVGSVSADSKRNEFDNWSGENKYRPLSLIRFYLRFLQIIASVLVGSCIVQGLPQRSQEQYDVDPTQQYKQQRQQSQPQPQPQDAQYERSREREASTFIPIIRFEKEQGDGGTYKTA